MPLLAENTENWPRCVQLAWQVHDELGNLIECKSYIVKPDDYDIPFESEKIHGISTFLAEKEGINLDDILNEFNDSLISSINVLPEEDSLDTAREKIEYGMKLEEEKRIKIRNFKDDVLMSEIVRNMESRESSLFSAPGSPPSTPYSVKLFSPPHTAGSNSKHASKFLANNPSHTYFSGSVMS